MNLLQNATVITVWVVQNTPVQYSRINIGNWENEIVLTQEPFPTPKTGKCLAATFDLFNIKIMHIDLPYNGNIIRFHEV